MDYKIMAWGFTLFWVFRSALCRQLLRRVSKVILKTSPRDLQVLVAGEERCLRAIIHNVIKPMVSQVA